MDEIRLLWRTNPEEALRDWCDRVGLVFTELRPAAGNVLPRPPYELGFREQMDNPRRFDTSVLVSEPPKRRGLADGHRHAQVDYRGFAFVESKPTRIVHYYLGCDEVLFGILNFRPLPALMPSDRRCREQDLRSRSVPMTVCCEVLIRPIETGRSCHQFDLEVVSATQRSKPTFVVHPISASPVSSALQASGASLGRHCDITSLRIPHRTSSHPEKCRSRADCDDRATRCSDRRWRFKRPPKRSGLLCGPVVDSRQVLLGHVLEVSGD